MTRVDQSVEIIKKMIIDKKYDAYGYLPSEGELCDILQVSKATVREAIRTLEVRGFVNRMHGKGIKVAVGSGSSIEIMTRTMQDMFETDELTLDDVLEVRCIIETHSITRVIEGITNEDLKELLGYVEAMECSKSMDAEYQENDFCFHKKIVHCSKNKMLISIVNAYSDWLKDLILVSSPSVGNLEATYHYHRNIYDALKNRDIEAVQKMMQEHHVATDKNKRETIK